MKYMYTLLRFGRVTPSFGRYVAAFVDKYNLITLLSQSASALTPSASLAALLSGTLAVFASPIAQAAAEKKWAEVRCPSNKELARDFLELQISGWRIPRAKPSCVSQDRFKYFKIGNPVGGDIPPDLKIQYVDEKKPFEITSIEATKENDVTVRLKFNIVQKDGGRASQEDVLTFKRNEGAYKPYQGCAGIMTEPAANVMRSSCDSIQSEQ